MRLIALIMILLACPIMAAENYIASGAMATRNTNHWIDITSTMSAVSYTNNLRYWAPCERDPSNNVPWQAVSYGSSALGAPSAAEQPVWSNGALVFDGVDDRFSAAAVPVTFGWTASVWIKLSTTNDVGIFSRWYTTLSQYVRWGVTNRKLTLLIKGATATHTLTDANVLSTGVWYHVAVLTTNGGTEQAVMLTNGVVCNATLSGVSGKPISQTAPGAIGAYQTASSTHTTFFNGLMDDIEFWGLSGGSAFLSVEELQDRYNRTNKDGRR